MKVGQVYQAVLTGNKAHIASIDKMAGSIAIEWFYVDGKTCEKEKELTSLSQAKDFIKNGIIEIIDDLPKRDPNSLFKENKL